MKTKPEIIVTALDLRAKGMTLGNIQQHLIEIYNYRVARKTILAWQNKFGKMINNFTKQFFLPCSKNAHADEVFFRVKGSTKDEFVYYWDCIDYNTKFLIGDHMSDIRSDEQAIAFLKNIKLNLLKPPDNIHTDNSWDYPPAIKKVFGKKTKHIHFPAWKRKFKNNPIERLHKTIKANYKVLCKFVNTESAYNYLIFIRNYYNFIRKHKTLKYQTPAKVAGFGEWTWWKIIKITIMDLTYYW